MSESEEMYLVSISRLKENRPSEPVPMRRLAKQLNVQPVSANQMIRKLEEAGMVIYTPYRGIDLTESGRQQTAHILRHRRLWEVFLVEKLNLSLQDATALACKLEHVTPDEIAERLADYLGRPDRSPEGKQIPTSQGGVRIDPGQPLSGLRVGEIGQVVQIQGEAQLRAFLTAEEIQAGTNVSVWGTGEAGGMLVRTDTGRLVHMAKELARMVYVKKD